MHHDSPNDELPVAPLDSIRPPLVPVVAAIACGVMVDRYAGIETHLFSTTLLWWAISSVALLAWWNCKQKRRPAIAGYMVLAAVACLAAGWHHWHWNEFPHDELGRFATEQRYPCCIEAIALASPERVAAPPVSPYRAMSQGEKSQLQLRIVRVRNGDKWQPASGRCDAIVDGHLLGTKANDRIQVFGQLQLPSPARNPGQFDFALHQRSDRELCLLRCTTPECITVLTPSSYWNPRQWIDSLRSGWGAQLWRGLAPNRAPIATAILLGARNTMSREELDAFRITGAMHVLVVSGLHAGVLIAAVFALLRLGFLPRRVALILAMLLVAAYVVLTGGYPPVIRAAILAELACVALWFDRSPFAFNSMAAAGIVVLMLNPSDLFRTGPQLSFLCAAILLWFSTVRWLPKLTPLQVLLRSVRPWPWRVAAAIGRNIGWTMAATLAVWVISLPLLMYQYHLVSPIAVVTSPLVFLTLMASLVTGFAYLIGGWLLPIAEVPLARLCDLSVAMLEGVVDHSSELPYAYAWTPAPSLWWVLGWYGLLIVLLRLGGSTWGWQRTTQVLAAWAVVGVMPSLFWQTSEQPLRTSFLDVGHGVCCVVTTPGGTTLMYDAGSLGSPGYATDTVAGYLWSRGIRTIDGLVLSHADIDHFNAVPGIVDRFHIGRVFVSPHMFPRNLDPTDHSAPAELYRLLVARGIAIEIIELGDRLTIDATTHADVLYPDRLGSFGSDNSNSLVLAVECAGHRILLPGDLEAPGIDDLMADERYDCDVLMAPHHGSRRSDPPGFAAWSQPEYVIVSGGEATPDHTTADSYRRRGAEVLSTGECGAIEITYQNDGISIDRYR